MPGVDTIGAVLRRADFHYVDGTGYRQASVVGPETGAEHVILEAVDLAPGATWTLDAAATEENIAVVFAGGGTVTTEGPAHSVERAGAVHSPTGHRLTASAGSDGLSLYVWRTRLPAGADTTPAPRTFGSLWDDTHQLTGFTGVGSANPVATATAVMNFVFWPGNGSARLCLHCGIQQPGQTFNVHVHPDSDEAFIAFEGQGQVYLLDRWIDVQAGDVLFARPGVPHGARHPDPDAGSRFVTCGGPTPFDPVLYQRAGFDVSGG